MAADATPVFEHGGLCRPDAGRGTGPAGGVRDIKVMDGGFLFFSSRFLKYLIL
jgi:hypothetical protein